MKKALLILLGIILVALWASPATADSARNQVMQGNKLYQEGKFDEALGKYREAQIEAPELSEAFYNIGDAYYRKKEYEKAIENFSQSLATQNPKLESMANYNIGNCKYRMGESKALTDLKQAVDIYREALDYYKRAIELDPENLDARFNHELIELKIKELLSKQKEQQDKQKGESKDQNDQKQDKKGDQQQSQQDEQKKKEEEQKKQAGQQDEKKEQDKDGDKQQAQKVNISKEEAERLLKKMMDEQRIRRQNNQKPKGTSSNDVDKDW